MPHCFDIHGHEFPEEQLPSAQPQDPAESPAGISPILAEELSKKTRREEILRLRLQGWSPAQIAKKLGGTEQSIFAILRIALNRITRLESKSAEKLKEREVQLELARLDEFLKALWPIIEGSDKKSKVTVARAVEVALKISERRAKLLGIDQPEKQLSVNINQDVAALSEAELEARARELGLNLPASLPAELPPPLEVANLLPAPTDSHAPATQTVAPEPEPDPSSTQSAGSP